MRITPQKLREIAELARKEKELKRLRLEAELERQRLAQEAAERERKELEQAIARHRIAVAARLRAAKRAIVVASFDGMVSCDVAIDDGLCDAFLNELALLGFKTREVLANDCSHMTLRLVALGRLLRKIIGDIDDLSFAPAYRPDARQRLFASVLSRAESIDEIVELIPNARLQVDKLVVEAEVISKALRSFCDSCPDEGLRAAFVRVLDHGEVTSVPEEESDDGYAAEFNLLRKLVRVIHSIELPMLTAIDSLKLVPVDVKRAASSVFDVDDESDEEEDDEEEDKEDEIDLIHRAAVAEEAGKRLIEVSWGGSDWSDRAITGKLDAGISAWLYSTSGQGLREKIENSMKDCARTGVDELNVMFTELPLDPERWGQHQVWKVTVKASLS